VEEAVLPECTVHPADITVLLEVREVVHLDTPMPLLAVQETRLHHQALLILMPCKDLLAGLMPLLVMVMQLLVVVAAQVGQGVLLQELLFPVLVRLVVLVLFLTYLVPL